MSAGAGECNHVEHWLNGKKVVEYEWGSPEVKELIAKSKFSKWQDFMTKSKGYIAFQFHGDVVSSRGIFGISPALINLILCAI